MRGGFFPGGYRVLRMARRHSVDFLNLCAERHFVYRSLETDCEADTLTVTVSEWTARRMIPQLTRMGIETECVKEGGLAALGRRLLKRPGLAVGAALCAAILILSSGVLWDIRVDGCRRVREAEVQELLRTCGLKKGLWRSTLDTAVIENRVMILSDDISWISINIIGTVAQVEIREAVPLPEEDPPMAAANLVAARDGVILWMEDVRGNTAVSVGDDVAEGQLLVGGLYGSETDGLRYTVAKGRVYAETTREFSVEIPFAYEQKVYTGRVKTEKYLIFFEKEVKFFGNCGNLYESCDTIDTVEYARVFEGEDLPLGIRTVRYLEYTVAPALRSEEEALALAEYELRCWMESEAGEAELTSLTPTVTSDGERLILRAKATYIENIAVTQEIEVAAYTNPNIRKLYGTDSCKNGADRGNGKAVRQL